MMVLGISSLPVVSIPPSMSQSYAPTTLLACHYFCMIGSLSLALSTVSTGSHSLGTTADRHQLCLRCAASVAFSSRIAAIEILSTNDCGKLRLTANCTACGQYAQIAPRPQPTASRLLVAICLAFGIPSETLYRRGCRALQYRALHPSSRPRASATRLCYTPCSRCRPISRAVVTRY